MVRYRAISNGNWSNLAIWEDDSSGSFASSTQLPQPTDQVYSNNRTVQIDQDIEVEFINNLATSGIVADGEFVLAGDFNITANIGINTYSAKNTLLRINNRTTIITGTVGAHVRNAHFTINISNNSNVTINGDIWTAVAASGGTQNRSTISCNNSTLIVNGDLLSNTINSNGQRNIIGDNNNITINGEIVTRYGGGSSINGNNNIITVNGAILQQSNFSTSANAINGDNNSITINGGIIKDGNFGRAINGSNLNIDITGTIEGGVNDFTINTSNSNININGTLTSYTIGTGIAEAVIRCDVLSNISINGVINADNNPVITGAADIDISTISYTFTNTSLIALEGKNSVIKIPIPIVLENIDGFVPFVAQKIVFVGNGDISWKFINDNNQDRWLYTAGFNTGHPSESDTREGVVYGPNNELEGELIVPDPSNVRKGVPTDNTVGTADLTAQDFLDALTNSTDDIAVRLRNVATVQTTGDQIQNLIN